MMWRCQTLTNPTVAVSRRRCPSKYDGVFGTYQGPAWRLMVAVVLVYQRIVPMAL